MGGLLHSIDSSSMAYNQAGPSSQPYPASFAQNGGFPRAAPRWDEPTFDVFEWHPHYRSCQQYFLDIAQHDGNSQALAAHLNIQLPFQKTSNPIYRAASSSPRPTGPEMGGANLRQFSPHSNSKPETISLTPYIRRLIVTGYDTEQILGGLFGASWRQGVGHLVANERRNYLFTSKCGNWLDTKKSYDMSPEELVPFMLPLRNATEPELKDAEQRWVEWLAHEDWMLGERWPDDEVIERTSRDLRDRRIKRESQQY